MKKIKDMLFYEINLTTRLKLRVIDIVCFCLITMLCILIRLSLFNFKSADYNTFLQHWFATLKENGGFKALSISLGDYTPPYFYILAFLTYLPIDPLYSIKIVSCIFDFILAFTVMRIIFSKYQDTAISLFAYSVTLLSPTVLLNSACWGQCDVIFVTFLVLCVYYFIKEKPIIATVFFAISFCFKLQAVFLAPFLIFIWLNGRMKFRHFFIIPGVYILSILPSAIAGRSFTELLTIYVSQSGQYTRLSLNAPSMYSFIGSSTDKSLSLMAILICGCCILISLYLLLSNKSSLTPEFIVTISLFFAILVPFLLPHMHERYFYLADVLAIVYAFYRPKRFYVPVLVIFSSLFCYLPFLFGETPISIPVASLVMLTGLIVVAVDIYRQSKILQSE